MIALRTVISLMLLQYALSENEWKWNNNNREEKSRSGLKYESDNARYFVDENNEDLDYQQRPIRPISSPGGIQRPPISNQRPILGVPPYGLNSGSYGQGSFNRPNYYPTQQGPENTGILSGPIPSWTPQGPFKTYDTCKCTEKFNCQSPGISYGNCDVGKKYCCYNKNKIDDLGSDYPSRPVHSPENGILVGPGYNGNGNRPNYGRPHLRPDFNHGRPENGILVGPGGPTLFAGRDRS